MDSIASLAIPPLPLLGGPTGPVPLGAPAAPGGATPGGSIDEVAQGFESMFASLLIKQMRQTLEPDTMFGQDQGDVLGGMFDFFLGQHLAQTGALGIGAMVRRQMPQARATYDRTSNAGHDRR